MRLLLDTHALLWAVQDGPPSETQARRLLDDLANEVWVSVVSLWEITVKVRVGKLRVDIAELTETLAPSGFALLELQPKHLVTLAQLPFFADHRDPFDHMLIAQAVSDDLAFVSDDGNVSRYPVRRVSWSKAR